MKNEGLIISTFLILSSQFLLAQTTTLNFNQASLVEVIEQIEKNSNWQFNFNPEIVAPYEYTGILNTKEGEQMMFQLLQDTPFTFEILGTDILIYKEKKTLQLVCGYIIDQKTQVPLSYVNVFADDQINGTTTDENGYFELSFEAINRQTIFFKYIGYQEKQLTIKALQQSERCSTISLSIDLHLFDSEIIVRDYILDGITEGEDYSKISLDYTQLTKMHSPIEHDLLKTVQFLPGIVSLDGSATNLQIRGSTADQNLLLWEDTPIYGAGHFFGMISAINPFVVDKVEVHKGVYRPSYDNRVGGVIDMSLSDSIAHQWKAGVGATLTEVHAFAEVPILKNKLSLILSGRRSFNSWIETTTITNYSERVFQGTKVEENEVEEGTIIDQILSFHDWNTKLLFRPNSKLLFTYGSLRTQNSFSYSILFEEDQILDNDQVNNKSTIDHIDMQFQISPHWQILASYSFSTYKSGSSFALSSEEDSTLIISSILLNDIRDQKVGLEFLWNNQKDLLMNFGYDYSKKKVSYLINEFAQYEFDYFIFEELEGRFSNFFYALDWTKKKWKLNLGARLTQFQELERWYFSPRLNLQYVINESLKLKGAVGRMHQFIGQIAQVDNNELNPNNPLWVLTNFDDGTPLTTTKYALGLLFQKDGWLLDVEYFDHNTKGINTITNKLGGIVSQIERVFGNTVVTGLDVLLRKRWKQYHLWMNYSYNKAVFKFPELEVPSFPANNDFRHNWSIANTFSFHQWQITLNWQYRTGTPFSEPTAIVQDEEDFYLEFEDLNRNRYPSFSRFDLGIQYITEIPKTSIKVASSFSIINLFGEQTLFQREYFLEEDEDAEDDAPPVLHYFDKFLLRRTPQLLVRLYF